MNCRSIDKAYLYVFWRLLGWVKSTSYKDGFHVAKTEIAITLLEGVVVLSVFILAVVIFEFDTKGYPLKIIFFIVTIMIGFFNYFALYSRWRIYEDEFKDCSRRQHLLYGWLIAGAVILIIAGLIGSFYLLSQSPVAYCSTHAC